MVGYDERNEMETRRALEQIIAQLRAEVGQLVTRLAAAGIP